MLCVFGRNKSYIELLGTVSGQVHGELLGGEVELKRRAELVDIVKQLIASFFLKFVDHVSDWSELVFKIVDLGPRPWYVLLVRTAFLSAEAEVASICSTSAASVGLFLLVVVDNFRYKFLLFLGVHFCDSATNNAFQALYFLVDLHKHQIFISTFLRSFNLFSDLIHFSLFFFFLSFLHLSFLFFTLMLHFNSWLFAFILMFDIFELCYDFLLISVCVF